MVQGQATTAHFLERRRRQARELLELCAQVGNTAEARAVRDLAQRELVVLDQLFHALEALQQKELLNGDASTCVKSAVRPEYSLCMRPAR